MNNFIEFAPQAKRRLPASTLTSEEEENRSNNQIYKLGFVPEKTDDPTKFTTEYDK